MSLFGQPVPVTRWRGRSLCRQWDQNRVLGEYDDVAVISIALSAVGT